MPPKPLYHLFGGVRASVDGVEVDLGGPKQRAVLALLLLTPRRAITADRIIDAVWGERPPSRAEASLRGYVSNLRKALGGDPDRISWRDEGYVLDADASDVDIHQFEDRVAIGQAALRAAQLEDARDALSDALQQWTEPPFGPLAGELPVGGVVAQLEARRSEAEDALADARLALGEHDALVPDLVAAVGREPLRERRRAQLALALYRCGRSVEALRTIADARRLLADEVGVAPSAELVDLERAILEHDAGLAWRPVAATALPEKGRTSSGFVGRDRELGVLLDAVAGARSHGRAVVVSGEAGIGKTALIAEIAAQAESNGFLVAWGRCSELASTSPYRPWRSISASLSDAGAGSDLADALASVADEDDDAVSGRLRVHARVSAALKAMKTRLFVVLDDLQWADDGSLALLELLADEFASLPMFVAATLRTPIGDADTALVDCLGAVARSPGFHRLELTGLAEDDLGAWIDQSVGAGAGSRLAGFVHARTNGNPFFAHELVALLASEGRLDDPTGARDLAVPAAVQDVVRRRTSRLPPRTQQVLSAAAVLGRTFDADIVAAIVATSIDEALDALVPALDAALIEADLARPGRFAFGHALVAETLVAEQNAIRLARFHAAATRAIEALRPPDDTTIEALAHHAYAGAAAGTGADAIDYATRAAAQASAAFLYGAAATHLEHALSALDVVAAGDRNRRQELLTQLGIARGKDGDVFGARAALIESAALAEAVGDTHAMATALAHVNADDLWSSLDWAQHDPQAIELIEHALTELGPADTTDHAELLAAMAAQLYHVDPGGRADALSAEAVAIATRVGDPHTLARVLVQRYWAMWRPAGNPARTEAANALIALSARGEVSPAYTPLAHLGRFVTAYELGDAEQAEASLQLARVAADPVRTPSAWTYVGYAELSLLLLRGSFEEAETATVVVHDRFRRTRPFVAATIRSGVLAQIHTERGDTDEALRELEVFESTPYASSIAWYRAWVLAEGGRLDETAEALHSFDGPLADDWYRIVVLTAATHAAATIRDRDFIERHLGELRPLADFLACAGSGGIVLGPVSLALARAEFVLGDEVAARAHLTAAIAMSERTGAAPWLERARMLDAR